jgi:hypothetical protein
VDRAGVLAERTREQNDGEEKVAVMIQRFFLLVFLASACLPSSALAQGAGKPNREADWLDSARRDGRARPFIEVSCGMSTPQFRGADFDFESIGLLEFKLGATFTL